MIALYSGSFGQFQVLIFTFLYEVQPGFLTFAFLVIVLLAIVTTLLVDMRATKRFCDEKTLLFLFDWPDDNFIYLFLIYRFNDFRCYLFFCLPAHYHVTVYVNPFIYESPYS